MQKINKDQVKTFIESDRAILMVCISIAFVFWLFIKLSKTFTTTNTYHIVYNLPEGKTSLEIPPANIIATLSGEGWDLISSYVRDRENNIYLNLSEESPQTISQTRLRNEIGDKLMNKAIDVKALSRDFITLDLEDQGQKKVPILLQEAIEYKDSFYKKDSIILSPDSVIVYGAASLLDSIDYWETNLLRENNVSADIQREITLKKPVKHNFKLEEHKTTVAIAVEQYTENQIFVPVEIQNASDSLKIFPESVKINFIVGLSRYNKINKDDFKVVVDFKNVAVNSKNNTLPIQLMHHPAYIRNIQVLQKSIEFYILK